MAIKIKKKPKRKPGEKAGLTREKVVAAALSTLEKDHELTISRIAKRLHVAPGAVYAHFPGKIPEISTEMVRAVLADAARPVHPNETWEAYFRDLFVAFAHAFHGHRNLSVLGGQVLSANYLVNPLLTERILVALKLAGVPDHARPQALDLVMANLTGFIAVEFPIISGRSPSKWIEDLSKTLDGLSPVEHSQTKDLSAGLAKAAEQRIAQFSSSKPTVDRAKRSADLLIAGLKGKYLVAA